MERVEILTLRQVRFPEQIVGSNQRTFQMIIIGPDKEILFA